jgi:hypothetical protein
LLTDLRENSRDLPTHLESRMRLLGYFPSVPVC